MSNTRWSTVYDYFEDEENLFRCKVSKKDSACCGTSINKLKEGSSSSNLKRHLKRHHPQQYKSVEQKDSKKVKLQQQPKGQTAIPAYFPKSNKKAIASISYDDFKSGMLKMLVYNGVPLSFFQGDGFKLLNGDFARSLGIPLGRDAIREMLLKRADEEKKKLKDEISGMLISIKFDGVTRLRSHFLGISAQYFNTDYGMTSKTLALIDTEANHTSANLKNFLLSTLREYEINIQQILACVVDNAANMTRTVELLNEEQNEDEDDTETDEEIETDEIIHIDHTIYHMRCAEHTFQLGIRDALKKGRPEKFLSKIRKIAQFLRSPHTDIVLKRRAGKGMLIDMATRWGSTYLMLERLLELKCVVQDLGSQESHLSEKEWMELKEMVEILKCPHTATVALQKQDLTPGQCLLHWKQVVFKLEKMEKSLATLLSNSLKFRQKRLLMNEAFVAAVWVRLVFSCLYV